jgi:hypothetical protein
LVRIHTPLSDLRVPFEEYKVNYAFVWEKISKTPSAKMWNWKDDFVLWTVPLFNNPRKYVSQCHISHLRKECVGITFMYSYISWDVMLMIAFISKLCSRTSKVPSVGACWQSLTPNF